MNDITSASSIRRRRSGRRHPLAAFALIALGLTLTGGAYAAFSAAANPAESRAPIDQHAIDEGKKLFAANCATCHDLSATGTASGPSLVGVGAAAVSFQVGTGRMPLQMQGPQALQKPVQFTNDEIAKLAAFVASLGPGPGIPAPEFLDAQGDTARGAELFRINCAMCHNVAGAGGALTEGKFAPELAGVAPEHIYEAMVTGPQSMPVFSDTNISPEHKRDIITYLKYLDKNPSPGGLSLGDLGPVSEGLFAWIFGLGAIVALTVWITAKSN